MKTFNCIKICVLLSLTALVFVGCKNQDNYKPQTHTVEIKDMSFQPENLTVHNGDTVIWINKDMVTHDVTADNKAWNSPPLASESSWKKAITASDSYFCSIHVVMKGKVTVVE